MNKEVNAGLGLAYPLSKLKPLLGPRFDGKSKSDFGTSNTQCHSGAKACSADVAQTLSAHPRPVRSWSTGQSLAPTISLPCVFLPAGSLTPSPFSPAQRRPGDLQCKPLEKAPSRMEGAQPSSLGRRWHPAGAPACPPALPVAFWWAVNKPAPVTDSLCRGSGALAGLWVTRCSCQRDAMCARRNGFRAIPPLSNNPPQILCVKHGSKI